MKGRSRTETVRRTRSACPGSAAAPARHRPDPRPRPARSGAKCRCLLERVWPVACAARAPRAAPALRPSGSPGRVRPGSRRGPGWAPVETTCGPSSICSGLSLRIQRTMHSDHGVLTSCLSAMAIPALRPSIPVADVQDRITAGAFVEHLPVVDLRRAVPPAQHFPERFQARAGLDPVLGLAARSFPAGFLSPFGAQPLQAGSEAGRRWRAWVVRARRVAARLPAA